MSEAEAALHVDIKRHDDFARANFPELADPTGKALLDLKQTNPERLALISAHYQQNKQARAHLQALSTNRVNAQAQIAQRQREQQFQANDNAFNQWLSKAHPNYSKGARRNELTAAVKSYLRDDLGMDDKTIEYHYKQTGLLRTPQAQAMLANGAMWKLSQQAAKRIAEKRVHAPPVQRPGAFRPHGADAEDSVRSLQQQLEGAVGERALRLSVKLQKARRAAGI
jgi:hypothetical protein